MRKPCLIMTLLLALCTHSCDCGFFSGCPPRTDYLINNYFTQAIGKPDCKTVVVSYAGGLDLDHSIGILQFPVDVKEAIIRDGELKNRCIIDPECDTHIKNNYGFWIDFESGCEKSLDHSDQYENCGFSTLIEFFSDMMIKPICGKCVPSTFYGTWARYTMSSGVELFHHESSDTLYFNLYVYH